MILRNIRELVLRARSHAEQDHVVQGTYGSCRSDGRSVEYKGCAVGCLSTPHRARELADFLEKWLKPGTTYLDISDRQQRELLGEEFGITPVLAVAAEGLFEAQFTHGAAINFVKDFAEALVEGADVTDGAVLGWLQSIGVEVDDYDLQYLFEDGHSFFDEISNHLTEREDGDAAVSGATEGFLSWLRAFRPAR